MRMRHLLTTAAACGALFVAGCGGDEETGGTTTAAPTAGGASGDVVAVDIKDIKFLPMEVTVKVGQTVEWTNSDSIPHNVVADAFKSENMDQGAKFTYKADKAGTFDYVCTIHSGQTGKLIVEEA